MPDPARPARAAHLALYTTEPMSVGYGFVSGLLSALAGIAAFGVVLGLRFPEHLALADLRFVYSSAYMRPVIHVLLVASFLLGSISAFLRANKTLALTGLGFTLGAALLGGSRVAQGGVPGGETPGLAVDFFVLNLLLYSAVFVPLERIFALRTEQLVFRRQWMVDLTYFFINSLLVEVLTLLTLSPALILFDGVRVAWVSAVIASSPVAVQVLVIVLLADFTQYWVHRAFHAIPFLWPIHAIHHSAEEMDWLAGSRLHLVDVILTRGVTYIPIFVLGFADAALIVYVFVVAAQATFIHANVRWTFNPLRKIVATPAFHHWHHSAEPEAVGKNFAVHTPIWDILFRTYYLPGQWPSKYGLGGGRQVPSGWMKQLLYPLRSIATLSRNSKNSPVAAGTYPAGRRAYAVVLGGIAFAFLLRVLGQALVAADQAQVLPPMDEWYSGLIPYPALLPIQVAILLLQATISRHIWRGCGTFAEFGPAAGRRLQWFSYVYAMVIAARYVVTMAIYPERRWFSGMIPILFHWVLAAYLFTLGRYYALQTHPRR